MLLGRQVFIPWFISFEKEMVAWENVRNVG